MAVGEGGGDSAPGPIVMKSRRCECVVLEKKAEGSFFLQKSLAQKVECGRV
jgi:hypothetical protein